MNINETRDRENLTVSTCVFTRDCDLCRQETDDLVSIDHSPEAFDNIPWIELCIPCAEVLTRKLLESRVKGGWHAK